MSLKPIDGQIWLDGTLIPWDEAKVHVLTNTLHYGMGVFEGVRAYPTAKGPAIFRLKEHTQRLLESAHIMSIPMPFDFNQMMTAQLEIMRVNKLPDAYIRPMVFLDGDEMGIRAKNLQTRVMVAAWQWPSYMNPEAKELGIIMKTSSYARHHVNVSMCRAKANGHYINSMLALNEALANGADEALLLDTDGFVVEGSVENIFVIKERVIYTPELTSCLNGITRQSIITLAQDLGYQVIEQRITRDQVYIADEVFLTGTAAEVQPVRELDTRKIGNGKRGPITEQLQTLYSQVVTGQVEQYSHWLSIVE